MLIRNEKIFDSWGETLFVDSYEDFMTIDQSTLYDMVIQRNLIVIKGLPPDLKDGEFYALGNKFGKVWTQEDYRKTFITRGFDPTIDKITKPVE